MLAELAFLFTYFALAVIGVLVAGYLIGWGRLFGSNRLVDQVDTAATLVCRGGLVLFFAGLLIAFAGYRMDHALITRIGAIMIAISLPLIVVAEHWGTSGRRRA